MIRRIIRYSNEDRILLYYNYTYIVIIVILLNRFLFYFYFNAARIRLDNCNNKKLIFT